MKQIQVTILMTLSALLLVACAMSDQGAQPGLENIDWVLATYNNNSPLEGRQPTIRLENGQVKGTTGCNHYGGSYQIKGDAISFEGVFSTEMACLEPEGLMEGVEMPAPVGIGGTAPAAPPVEVSTEVPAVAVPGGERAVTDVPAVAEPSKPAAAEVPPPTAAEPEVAAPAEDKPVEPAQPAGN